MDGKKTASRMAGKRRLFQRGQEDRGNSGRWRSALVVLLVSGVTVAIGLFGFRQLWDHVVALDEFKVYPGEIEVGPLPWIDTGAFREDLRRWDSENFLGHGYSILSSNLTGRAAAAYERSPWVRRVLVVRKDFPNRLYVQLDLRRPYATIEYRGKTHLVDCEGVYLDQGVYRTPPEGLGRLPVRLEVVSRLPVLGEVWQDGGVLLALDMLRFMEERDAAFAGLDLKCIEVQREGAIIGHRRNVAVLRTGPGTIIRWGSSPYRQAGDEAEVTPDEKLRALHALIREFGDKIYEFRYIDLRWDRPAYSTGRAADNARG